MDGPALRSYTLMLWAEVLLKNGRSDEVYDKLWRKDGNGAIQKDIDYVL